MWVSSCTVCAKLQSLRWAYEGHQQHNRCVMPTSWLRMVREDEPDVERIADAVHNHTPGLHERTSVLMHKRELYPSGCYVLRDMEKTVGYGFSHLWVRGDIPDLDRFLPQLNRHANVMYVHDVAILPEYRGDGLIAVYLHLVRQQARKLGITRVALTAVRGSHVVWARYGFVDAEPDNPNMLTHYGAEARYMESVHG